MSYILREDHPELAEVTDQDMAHIEEFIDEIDVISGQDYHRDQCGCATPQSCRTGTFHDASPADVLMFALARGLLSLRGRR